jgi:uncharacterized protein
MHLALEGLVLLLAGLASGMVNAVAGGASVFLYPLLLAFGVAPIMANATTSVSIWPGAISSAYGYRQYLKKLSRPFYLLLIPCIIGGGLGAVLLGRTPDHIFRYLVPWLILFTVTLLALQTRIRRRMDSVNGLAFRSRYRYLLIALAILTMLGLGTYGGYFGGGFGMMMLAFLAFTPMTNIHQMNGFKNLASATMNTIAIAYFIHHGLIHWQVLPLLLLGNVVGGLLGSTYSTKLPEHNIKLAIIICGMIISIALLLKLYL